MEVRGLHGDNNVTSKAWRDEYDEKVLLPMMRPHRKFLNPEARNTTNPPPAAPPDELFDEETTLDVESDVERRLATGGSLAFTVCV